MLPKVSTNFGNTFTAWTSQDNGEMFVCFGGFWLVKGNKGNDVCLIVIEIIMWSRKNMGYVLMWTVWCNSNKLIIIVVNDDRSYVYKGVGISVL